MFINTISAQTFVGKIDEARSARLDSPRKLNDETFKEIKNKKIIFLYDNDIYDNIPLKEFESIVKKAWSVTDFEIQDYNNYLKNAKEGDYIAKFDYTYVTSRSRRGKTVIISKYPDYPRLDFGIVKSIKTNKNGIELKTDDFASIHSKYNIKIIHERKKIFEFKYYDTKSHLLNSIQLISNCIKNEKSYISWGNFVDVGEIQKLKIKDLYSLEVKSTNKAPSSKATDEEILEYLKTYPVKISIGKYRKRMAKYEKKNPLYYGDSENIYNYSIKPTSPVRLEELIFNTKEDLFYIKEYSIENTRIIQVVNALNGDVVFQNIGKNKPYLENLNKAIETGDF